VPEPPAASPTSGPPATLDLPAMLAATEPGDRAAALARILTRWQVAVQPEEDPCRAALRAGLECFDGRGSWTLVRRLGLPVAVKLLAPDGTRHWAAVTSLEGEAVTLQLGNGILTVPATVAERLWDGVFSLVWRPLPGAARVLGPGTQGPAVTWLRRSLTEAGVATEDRGPAVYDAGLAASVVVFQRREGLEPDGVAGIETLVRLSTRLDRGAPLLSAATP
jgi:general secretion pathway protein A